MHNVLIGIRYVYVLKGICNQYYRKAIFFLDYQQLLLSSVVVVVDLPLLRVALEGSDNPISLEKPCHASLPPDQQGLSGDT